MGIFLKTNDSALRLIDSNSSWSFPKQLSYPDYMCKQRSTIMTGPKSAAALLSQYADTISYQVSGAAPMSDSNAVSSFYTSVAKSANGYITLYDGMQAVAAYIRSSLSQSQVSNDSIIWLKSADACKRYVHRNNYIIVEMCTDPNLLNYSGHLQGNTFKITAWSSPVSTAYTKCFICCGYDADGLLLYNSLGTSYGSYGFVHVANDVFEHDLVKAATLNNIFG